ncbi:MAG TPA: endolytic transglycosylase MltG, partial [candidate division Zixibacteria bacterium]|nr:endolytic transglycosylase MltG [candidate division Zixibacteria bacterium]
MAKNSPKIGWILLIIAVCTGIAIAYSAMQLYGVQEKSEFSVPVEVEVPRGANLDLMADLFADAGMVDAKWKFIVAARLTGVDRKLRAGRYTFKRPVSPVDLVKNLTKGGAFDILITFPEGYTVFEIARLAEDSLGISADSVLALCFRESFIESLGLDAPSCEGYLFPETYKLPEGLSAETLIKRMVAHFWNIWTPKFEARARELGLTRNQVVTLASIIEGEAHVVWEQPVVSSVYHNRLRIGMLLQADPTTIYGLRSFDRKLTLADLDTSSSL